MRSRALVSVVAAIILALPAVATAGDPGQWSSYPCGTGRGCFYRDSIGGTVMLQSPVRDSDFTDDSYAGAGGVLNDRVRYVVNTFNNMKLKVFQDINYMSAGWCIAKNGQTGLLPYNQLTGASSFRAIVC